MTTYRKWDIVLVRFPFTDLTTAKKRPVLVVSPNAYNQLGQDLVVAFITSRTDITARYGDHPIQSWKQSGLPKPSLLRMKFATIDGAIIEKKIGRLVAAERKPVLDILKRFFTEC
jgi:mRNA interferase MazF